MSAEFIAVSRLRLADLRTRLAHSPAWRQAFIVFSLVLFVLAAMFPADSRDLASSGRSSAASSWLTPCDLVACEQAKARRGQQEIQEQGESPGDSVRYREGTGFIVPTRPEQHSDSPGLSQPF
jgi:hypothetical protein